MNINDKSVLEMLNKLIVINRLNKSQILQMVNLVSISNNIKRTWLDSNRRLFVWTFSSSSKCLINLFFKEELAR